MREDCDKYSVGVADILNHDSLTAWAESVTCAKILNTLYGRVVPPTTQPPSSVAPTVIAYVECILFSVCRLLQLLSNLKVYLVPL